MTKNEAISQATKDCTMYQQGRGWILSTYDPEIGANRVSHEMAHGSALEARTQNRAERALELLGVDPQNPDSCVAYDMEQHGGTVRDRVNHGLKAAALAGEVTR